MPESVRVPESVRTLSVSACVCVRERERERLARTNDRRRPEECITIHMPPTKVEI